jgi:cyclophilin family peptidyl-prolyl cis-trans isomerase
VKGGYLEGGFIKSRRGAEINESVYGGFFSDENYIIRHNRIGVLGMSKQGAHNNGSVFYITLKELPHLNRQYVAFGRVIEGLETLRELEALETNYQRPVQEIII